MSTQATTPEITINNTAQEIKAALEAQVAQPAPVTSPATSEPTAAPPAPPAEPVKPAWGELAKNQDGTYQVTLSTGEVFKGTADEVIAKQAEAQYNTKRWGQEWKQKFEAGQQVVPTSPSPTPQAPQESPEVLAARQWIVDEFAREIGVDPAQFRQLVPQMFETTQKMGINTAWADFTQACPDYVDDQAHAEALVEYLPNDVLAQQRPPNADELRRAHAMALYDKKYQGAAQPASPVTTTPPPIMPSSGVASTATSQPNPWTMPKDQLKREADAWLRGPQ